MKSKLVVVQDANVLMDLINGGILDAWFQVGVETWTTDFVIAEITHPEQHLHVTRAILARQLRISEIPPDSMAEEYPLLLGLQETWGISIPDASVLRTAQKQEAPLMSGDRRLRKAASDIGIEIKGVLWALDELVEGGHLTAQEAADALERMLQSGSHLPREECGKRLSKWRK